MCEGLEKYIVSKSGNFTAERASFIKPTSPHSSGRIGNLVACSGLLSRAPFALSNQALANCSNRSRIMRVVESARLIGSPVIGVAMQAPPPPSKVKKEPGAYEVAT